MEVALLYLIVSVLVGALACFYGRRLFFVMLGLLVFVNVFDAMLASAGATEGALVVAALAGVAAALLSRFAYRVGAFLVGFVAGLTLATLLCAALLPVGASVPVWVVALVAGVLVGLLAMRFSDVAVALATAWSGASMLVPSLLATTLAGDSVAALAVPGDVMATLDAVSAYVSGAFTAAHSSEVLVGTVVLAVAGAVFQLRGAKR